MTLISFSQGWVEKPTYHEVCSGRTGHTEAVQVFYDRKKIVYRDLLGLFFSRINPTSINGQGRDHGTQYRTGVYPHTPEDRKVADEVFAAIAANHTEPIATELKDAVVFWPAEDYHQQYLSKVGNNPWQNYWGLNKKSNYLNTKISKGRAFWFLPISRKRL